MVVYYSNPKKLRHMVSVMSLQNKSSNNLKNNKTYRTKFCLVKQNRKHSKYIAFFFFLLFKIQQYNSPERRKSCNHLNSYKKSIYQNSTLHYNKIFIERNSGKFCNLIKKTPMETIGLNHPQ